MAFLVISFIAGVLTVLAPCILPLLPVVIGSSASGRSKVTPYVVVLSLGVSVILFTFLLKVSTAFIMIPPQVWTYLSGGIILLFGLTLLFPSMWARVPGVNKLSMGSNKLLGTGYQKKSVWGDVIVGASLGPIFSTCSPTYFVILASVLPASFLLGTVYLLAYTLGLSLILLCIALLGERFASKLDSFSNPNSRLKKTLGVIFIILGLLIASGYEKKLETKILDSGLFDITKLEHSLLRSLETSNSGKSSGYDVVPYTEIVNPAGFVNTNNQPVRIGDYVGEKVILLDFMTYSCINCQRTFPYVTSWYEQYKDEGLVVIGIHTPEFAFEKDKSNVEAAMREFGITFPVVLDNDYGTWRAYGNRYWPRKYLVDIHGNIVYDHIGEGAYEETEEKIRELLEERAEVLGLTESNLSGGLVSENVSGQRSTARSPETYFGSFRNEYLSNGTPLVSGQQTLTIPTNIKGDSLYLGGTWNIAGEYAESVQDAVVRYKYSAKYVYLVMESNTPAELEVWQDGKLVTNITVQESKLYRLIENPTSSEHTLEIRLGNKKVRLFAFTFG